MQVSKHSIKVIFLCWKVKEAYKFANVPYQTFEIGLADCFVDLSREVSLVGVAFHLVDLCLEVVCLVEVSPLEEVSLLGVCP